jgi:hypothetical protein
MPRQTYDTKADYDLISYKRVPGQDRLAGPNAALYHYHRNHEFPWHAKLADWLVNTSGFNLTRTAIIGSGFPWTEEALVEAGHTGSITSIDPSDYIQTADEEEPEHRAEIQRIGLDPDTGEGAALLAQMNGGRRKLRPVHVHDIGTPQGKNAIRAEIGGRSTFIYSEMVIGSLFEAEILQLTEAMAGVSHPSQGTVAHMVVRPKPSRPRPQFDIRSLAEWRAFFDLNGHSDVVLIDATTFEVG